MCSRYIDLLILTFLVSTSLFSQEKFDVYRFSIPANYKQQVAEKSVVLSTPDDKLSILLIPAKQAGNDNFSEFGSDWELFVTAKYTVLGFPNRKTTDFTGGWKMTTGQSKVQNGEQSMWVQLRNFIKNRKKATILFFAVDDKQQTAIQQFVSSLHLSDSVYALAETKPAGDNSVQSKIKYDSSQQKVVEVWMQVKTGAFNMSNDYYFGNYYDLSKNRMAYRVFFPDGNYTASEMPAEGLLFFNINSADAPQYTWGKYSRSADGITVKSAYENKKLNYLTKDKLEDPGWSNPLYKCKPVDGLKLDGSWSYIPNSEKDPYYDEPGCRPVIYFTKDGKFNDRGVFVSDCRYPNQYPENVPGEGTYEIKNFSLVLNYNDGRTIYKSFTAALGNNPFARNEIIYIRRNAFFKRKN